MDDENGGLGMMAFLVGIIGIGLLTFAGAKTIGIILCVLAVGMGLISL